MYNVESAIYGMLHSGWAITNTAIKYQYCYLYSRCFFTVDKSCQLKQEFISLREQVKGEEYSLAHFDSKNLLIFS